jgi:peptide/nickel transport system ATP-binding protein
MDNSLLLKVRDLTTHFHTEGGTVRAVNGVSFDLNKGERLAVVGESGSGKSAMAMSLIRLISYPGRVVGGSVELEGADLLQYSESQLNGVRGGRIGTVFQDPMSSLDPVMRIEEQMVLPVRKHLGLSSREARDYCANLLQSVGIPDASARLRSYPFELSGGMRQRVMIAMAMSCKPKLIIADEPTTALDVTIQAQIVELLKGMTESTGTSLLFITHDLGLVARFAQKVAVMYAGEIVELAEVRQLFASPRHPYTRSLLRTIPSMTGEKVSRLMQIDGFPPDMRQPAAGCSFRERCAVAEARCLSDLPELIERQAGHSVACWQEADQSQLAETGAAASNFSTAVGLHEPEGAGDKGVVLQIGDGDKEVVLQISSLEKVFRTSSLLPWQKPVQIKAVNGIDLTLRRGETVGLVGESGCGKSTTARLLLGLDQPTGGHIAIEGQLLSQLTAEEWKNYRKRVQMVFQDPYSSFNPKMRIGDIIAEPIDVHGLMSQEERDRKVRELIQLVGLEPSYLDRFPNQLSGGQRQRIGIARALALSPSVIVADEPTSALDVSVRAQVINLLCELKEQLGLSFIFISHDLSTVRHISDSIAVMYLGQIVEQGPAEQVFANPLHPYTRALLAAVPIPDPAVEERRTVTVLAGELPSPANPPQGCSFHSRCPLAQERCSHEQPSLAAYGEDRKAACHYAG